MENEENEIVEKILVRLKVPLQPNGKNQLIFDNEQEAQRWIKRLTRLNTVLEVKRAPGVVVRKIQNAGMLNARIEYVWQPLEKIEETKI